MRTARRTLMLRLAGAFFLFSVIVGPTIAAGAEGPRQHLRRSDDWYRSDEARRIADNVLTHQSDLGGWPKNTDTTVPYSGRRDALKPTFDNGATTDELRLLAKVFAATNEPRYRRAFEKGFDYILQAQYPNGGWPQSHPPGKGYPRHITFNDHAMVRLMKFVREVAGDKTFAFVDQPRRKAAAGAFDRGIGCILKCQVVVEGKRTVWCAQHDENDFRPRPARTFELVSLSGCESVEIVRLLMTIEKPSPDVVAAIEAAIAWFEQVKLVGIREVVEPDAQSPTGKNKVVVEDPKAPPLWARFYEIGSNRPLFVDRDGVPRYRLADIGYERRNGYAWLGNWPQALIERDYPQWKKKQNGRSPKP